MFRRNLFDVRICLFSMAASMASVSVISAEVTTVFVVRHAEKEKETLNKLIQTSMNGNLAEQTRPLSPKGMKRALDLRDLLRFEGVELNAVYSTKYLRTWQTGAPSLELIKSPNTSVETYDSIDRLAEMISRAHSGKNVLVVGHSNTVPEIVKKLTGESVPPIGNQFNNLFVVTKDGASAKYTRRTYGEFSPAGTLTFSESEGVPIEGSKDISGVAVMKDGSLLIASDESKKSVQVIKKNDAKYTAQRPLKIVDEVDDELDLEAVTGKPDSHLYFAVGSHSSRRKQIYKKHANKTDEKRRERFEEDSPDRQRTREQIFRFEIDEEGKLKDLKSKDLQTAIRSHNLLSHFYNRKVNGKRVSAIPSKENGIDIEGMAWHDNKLYLGLRGPVLRWNFVPVMTVDFDNLERTAVRYVQLNGRGIRDLVHIDDGFLILAGANGDEPLSYQLYFWNGKNCFPGKEDTPSKHVVLLGSIPAPQGSKPEGITVLNLKDEAAAHYDLLVVYDGLKGGRPTRYRLPR